MSDADAAFQQGYDRGIQLGIKMVIGKLHNRLSELHSKIRLEEHESRMWQYHVGAKDQLFELLMELVKRKDANE